MKRGVKAYFTLEAVLVLPLVLGVIGVVLFLLVYQYDRLLLEQDLGMLSVRVSSFAVPWEETEQEFTRLQKGVAKEKYLLGTWQTPTLEINPGKVSVCGEIRFPFEGRGTVMEKWEGGISASYKNRKYSPLFIIRSCKKVKAYLTGGEN